MRIVSVVLFILITHGLKAQKRLSIELAPQFNFLTSGLGTNDAGAGMDIRVTRSFNKTVDLAFETGWSTFWGSKELELDSTGNKISRMPHLFNSALSLEIQPIKDFYLGIAAGPSINRIDNNWYTDAMIKPSIAVNILKNDKGLVKFFYVIIPKPGPDVNYAGISFVARVL